MTASLLSKLDDSANPGAPSVWIALPVACLVLLLVLRCAVPQVLGLLRSWREWRRCVRAEREHRRFMEFEERKKRER